MKSLALVMISFVISSTAFSQSLNQEIKIAHQQPFLVGQINAEGLSSASYKNWFQPNLDNYTVDVKPLATLKNKLAEFKILVFMGTWCGDSKREVPRFLKILKTADFPSENLKMVAVDKRKGLYKKSPQGEEWGLNIRKVPTFIFYKNGREVNRIVESPVNSLEEDIMTIISQKEYIPNHSKSMHFD